MSKLFARPVWVGIAVRMDDGSVYAFEVTEQIEASVTVKNRVRERPGGDVRREDEPTGTGTYSVEAHVTGVAHEWTRWSEPQRERPAVKPPAREIEDTETRETP